MREKKTSFRFSKPSKIAQLVYSQNRVLTRKQKGKIAESAILLRLNLFEIDVYASLFDGDAADWVIELPGKIFYKIQVRWCKTPKSGSPMVSLQVKNNTTEGEQMRRLSNDNFDFIIGYYLHTDTAYVWSFDETKDHKSNISIKPDAEEAWHKIFSNEIADQ